MSILDILVAIRWENEIKYCHSLIDNWTMFLDFPAKSSIFLRSFPSLPGLLNKKNREVKSCGRSDGDYPVGSSIVTC